MIILRQTAIKILPPFSNFVWRRLGLLLHGHEVDPQVGLGVRKTGLGTLLIGKPKITKTAGKYGPCEEENGEEHIVYIPRIIFAEAGAFTAE